MREVEVYGKRLHVEKTERGWEAFHVGSDGKRRRAHEVPIPGFIGSEDELLQYLADLWHESARPDNCAVRWVR